MSDFQKGVIIGFCVTFISSVISSVLIESVRPTALDVYRHNTELKITSINGVPTDTVVVFKTK